ncbi:MAG: S9 family peptidase [Acidimicrobiia bacterium]
MPEFEDFADVWTLAIFFPPSFSPEGEEICYVLNAGDLFQVYRQPVDGTEPRAVTNWSGETPREVVWSPAGDWMAVLADRDGDEFNQVRLIPPAGGSVRKVTDDPGVQYYLGGFSPDGRWLSYVGNDRERSAQDLLLRDLQGEEALRFRPEKGQLFPGRWSPEGRRTTVTEFVHFQQIDVRLVGLDGGDRRLLESDGEGAYLPGPWTPDGERFYVISDAGREFSALYLCSAADGSLEAVVAPDWDVEGVTASRDGRVLAYSLNEDGVSRVLIRRDGSEEEAKLPPGVAYQIALSPDGTRLAAVVGTATSSPDLYVVNTDTGEGRRLTRTMRRIDPSTLGEPELAPIPNGRGGHVPGWWYPPRGERPAPVVVSVHGGPMSQERPEYRYHGMYHYLLSRGFGVLAPNITGSTGYGRSYTAALNRDLGGVDLADLRACVEWLRQRPEVDSERIGIFGGSYGGYVVLAALSMMPGLFAAGVDVVGPSNLVTLIETGPPTWKITDEALIGHPERDRDFLLSRSPVTHAEHIDVPLFIIQGVNDPRVPRSESDQIVQALRARRVEVRYDVYEDEGHGFVRHENRVKSMKDSAEWLIEVLGRPSDA